MKITIRLITSVFAVARVRGSAMVVDVGVCVDNFWKYPFVDVSCRKVGLSEVCLATLVRVVQIQFEHLSN